MAKKVYAKRFAQAVFDIALERKELDRWQSDLKKIASLGEDATVVSLLQNPRLRFGSKVKVLSERLGEVNPLALNLLYLLLARGRLSMIVNIADEYERLLNSYHGIEQAEVSTAIPIDDKDIKRLTEQLSTIIGNKIVVKSKVDSSLIGGIVARVGDKLLDGSTRNKLAALRDELAGAR